MKNYFSKNKKESTLEGRLYSRMGKFAKAANEFHESEVELANLLRDYRAFKNEFIDTFNARANEFGSPSGTNDAGSSYKN